MNRETCPTLVKQARPAGSLRALLSHLIECVRAGEAASVKKLLVQFPELQARPGAVLSLDLEEFLQRAEAGEDFDRGACGTPFPELERSLRLGIEAGSFAEYMLQANANGGEFPLPWPEVGTAFQGFDLLHELGRGTYARVYLARERALGGRPVALKVSLLGAHEADTLGQLKHPNIVPIHSIQYDPATGFKAICMPYLGGATLDHLIERIHRPGPAERGGALVLQVAGTVHAAGLAPEAEPADPFLARADRVEAAVHLAAQLAEALAFVHCKGIYHRDLKPSNVLLGPDGRPRLLDFNLAEREEKADRSIAGTLPYMAPEQVRRLLDEKPPPRDLGAGSDVFSLGVILYELLTGRNPYGRIPPQLPPRDASRLLLQRQRRGPPPLRDGCPEAGQALAALVGRCLAFEPAARPGSAAEFAAALRSTLTPLARWRRKALTRPAWWLAVLLALLAGLGTLHALPLRPPAAEEGPYARGVQAYERGDYPQAVDFFEAALRGGGNPMQARFARGRALQQLGKFDLALADYSAIAREIQDGRVDACLGLICQKMKQQSMAVDRYRSAEALGYAPPVVLNNLGHGLEKTLKGTQKDIAEQCLNAALHQDLTLQAAYHNRALLHYNRAGEARPKNPVGTASTLGLMVAPQGTGPWSVLLPVLPRLTRSWLAVQDIEHALQTGPITAELWFDAACCWGRLATLGPQARARALECVQQAIESGYEPRQLDDHALAALKHEPLFQELTRAPSPARRPAPAIRLLDPVAGIPTLASPEH